MKTLSVRALLLAIALVSGACGGNDSPTAPSLNVPFLTTDLRVGTGAEATSGRLASVGFTGWLYSEAAIDNKGSQFDTGSFLFTVNGGGVIPGFNQGVLGMKVGGLRRVVVPPSLGYGSAGRPPIPGNATLLFEVELLSVQ